MGGWISSLFGNTRARILLLGLDAAGKTTVLYQMKMGENIVTVPTIGFNVEEVKYKNLTFTMWDVGGQQKLRPLWRHYFDGSNALIWVVDSADRERISEAAEELQSLAREERLSDAIFLILANKQDLPNAMPTPELARALGLTEMTGRNWYIQSTVASTGAGLEEGMAWLAKNVKASGRR